MKRLIKKNQVIVAALALMIAAAGDLNYSGKLFSDKDDTKTANFSIFPRRTSRLDREILKVRIKTRLKQTEMWKEHQEKQYLQTERSKILWRRQKYPESRCGRRIRRPFRGLSTALQ